MPRQATTSATWNLLTRRKTNTNTGAWDKPGTLPDSWYQGAVSFSDRFWKIDVENRLASLLFDPEQLAEVRIDTVSPVADSVSRSLIFTNKTDGSLWLYEL